MKKIFVVLVALNVALIGVVAGLVALLTATPAEAAKQRLILTTKKVSYLGSNESSWSPCGDGSEGFRRPLTVGTGLTSSTSGFGNDIVFATGAVSGFGSQVVTDVTSFSGRLTVSKKSLDQRYLRMTTQSLPLCEMTVVTGVTLR